MEGVRKTSKSVDVRSHITLDILRAIFASCEIYLCEFTIFNKAFFTFLRVGEFTAQSQTSQFITQIDIHSDHQ